MERPNATGSKFPDFSFTIAAWLSAAIGLGTFIVALWLQPAPPQSDNATWSLDFAANTPKPAPAEALVLYKANMMLWGILSSLPHGDKFPKSTLAILVSFMPLLWQYYGSCRVDETRRQEGNSAQAETRINEATRSSFHKRAGTTLKHFITWLLFGLVKDLYLGSRQFLVRMVSSCTSLATVVWLAVKVLSEDADPAFTLGRYVLFAYVVPSRTAPIHR